MVSASPEPPADVVLLRWPEEQPRLERLRVAGTPRLLLVGEDLLPPSSVDPLEDWIRLPATEDDLRARVATLTARRSEEHTSELQSLRHLVCRLLLEKKNKKI